MKHQSWHKTCFKKIQPCKLAGPESATLTAARCSRCEILGGGAQLEWFSMIEHDASLFLLMGVGSCLGHLWCLDPKLEIGLNEAFSAFPWQNRSHGGVRWLLRVVDVLGLKDLKGTNVRSW